jgi:hypothetical protein
VDRIVIFRNLIWFDGLALLTVTVLQRASWSPLLLAPVVCWMLGVEPPGRVRWWALPLLPPEHGGALALSFAFGLIATALYVAWPPGDPVERGG